MTNASEVRPDETVTVGPHEVSTPAKSCPGCGRPFAATRVYCSPACKLSAWKRRQRIEPSPLLPTRIAAIGDVVTKGTPAAHTGADSAALLAESVRNLGIARGIDCDDGPGGALHLLASLAAEIELALPDALATARNAGYSWEAIRAISGISGERAKRLVALAHRKEAPLA
ncbi:MAG TPA: hypothetical protein VEH29_05765 [Acidimicrobiales bacterium]|nr:hypothetical protein [Acidimicrobiales bacterium]